jgi:hypothetical protein
MPLVRQTFQQAAIAFVAAVKAWQISLFLKQRDLHQYPAE